MSARSALRDTSVESPKAFLSTPFAESYNTYISHVCTVTREEVSLGELRAQTRKAKAKKGQSSRRLCQVEYGVCTCSQRGGATHR